MIGINSALEAAAITRISLANTGSVLAQVAPQFAVQAARLIQEALSNAKGKLDVAMAASPEMGRIGELMAAQAQNRPLLKPISDGPGEEAEQAWGSLGVIEFEVVNSPSAFSGKDGANYAQHAIIGGKPALQFTGHKLQELTITVSWHSYVTDGIEARLAGLLDCMDKREIVPYVTGSPLLGSVYVGDYIITGIDHTVKKYHPDGSMMALEATVKLLEWNENQGLEITEKKPKAVKEGKAKAPEQAAKAEISKDQQGNVVNPATGAAFGIPKTLPGAGK